MRIARADKPGIRTRVNETDMARTEKMIREARFMADYVIVSIHSHECMGAVKSEPAEFCVEFAHRCIDAARTPSSARGRTCSARSKFTRAARSSTRWATSSSSWRP